MRANLTATLFLIAASLLIGCKPNKDSLSINSADKESFMASVMLMSNGMSKADAEQFHEDLIIVMKDAAVGSTDKNGEPLHDENRQPEEVRAAINGMTVENVTIKAGQIRAQRNR